MIESTEDLLNEVKGILVDKVSFVGPTILTENALDIDQRINETIGKLGVLFLISEEEADVPHPDQQLVEFQSTIQVEVSEKVTANRRKAPSQTVANAAARLALTGLTLGTCVKQTDEDALYVLYKNTGAALGDWGKIRTASQWGNLVFRALHMHTLSNRATLTAHKPRIQTDAEHGLYIVQCQFQTRYYLNPEKPE